MLIQISASSTVPVYQQLKDQLRRSISSGILAADQQVPSVRDLAVHLQVNPNTVARAYRELEADGVLYSRKGQGTFVCSVQPRAARRERLDIIAAKVDDLLLELGQLDLEPADLIRLIEQRSGSSKTRT